jgi:hypothetical protein
MALSAANLQQNLALVVSMRVTEAGNSGPALNWNMRYKNGYLMVSEIAAFWRHFLLDIVIDVFFKPSRVVRLTVQ